MPKSPISTVEAHQAVVAPLLPLAKALPADAVKEPDMPVEVFLSEGEAIVLSAREHETALVAVGYDPETTNVLAQRLSALDSAQRLWMIERRGGRDEATLALIDEAETLRTDILAAGDLALRTSLDGQRRLALLREGDGLADLVADLADLAVLTTDYRDRFAAKKVDVDAWSTRAVALAKELQGSLATEKVEPSLSGNKELRDRIFTLCKEPLADLRAHAAFAFRKDKGSNRRHAFTSAYARRAKRRQRPRVNEPVG